MELIYAPNALRAEVLTWRAIIHLNLLKMMKIVIDAILQAAIDPSSQIQVTDEHRRLAMRLAPLKQAEELLRMRISLPEDDTHVVVANSTEFAVRSAAGWKEAFLKLRGQRGDAGTKEELQSAGILEICANDMVTLWSDPTVKNIVRQKRLRLEESSGLWVPSLPSPSGLYLLTLVGIGPPHSFLSDISRVASRNYMPTDDDILRARLPTVGVQEHKITLENGPEKGSVWYIFDVGGSRSQRATWEPFFDDGTRSTTRLQYVPCQPLTWARIQSMR